MFPIQPRRFADLSAALVQFAGTLRAAGIGVPVESMSDAMRLAQEFDWDRSSDIETALCCILVRRQEDLAVFHEVFERFWSGTERSTRRDATQPPRRFPDVDEGADDGAYEMATSAQLSRPTAEGEPPSSPRLVRAAVFSREEVLRRKDFAAMDELEIASAAAILTRIRLLLRQRPGRRMRPSVHGAQLDVRRAFRDRMRLGGELAPVRRRERVDRLQPLILLCDISGSMDRYTKILLHFLHALEGAHRRTEVFVFATRLTRITAALRHRRPHDAVQAVAAEVSDWSGGTRIGECVGHFNRHWARRIAASGATVVLISDGWDRGDPAHLALELRRLQRSCARTIWLNPLLGREDYRPLTRGMRAALPYVDDFMAAHNIDSLVAFQQHLNTTGRAVAKRLPQR